MNERINQIVKRPKTIKLAAFGVIVMLLATGGATLSSASSINVGNPINVMAQEQVSSPKKSAVPKNSAAIDSINFSEMNTVNIGKIIYFTVTNEEELRAIGSDKYTLADNYMLQNDITLTSEWVAIGNDNVPFTGQFEGNGYSIKNLTMTNKNAKYVGLFGLLKGGKVHNVTL